MAVSLLKLGSKQCTINSFRELWLERTSYLVSCVLCKEDTMSVIHVLAVLNYITSN